MKAMTPFACALVACAAPGDGSAADASDTDAAIDTGVPDSGLGDTTSPDAGDTRSELIAPDDAAPEVVPDVSASCEAGTYPTSGGRCLAAWDICQEAALDCGADAVCEVWAPVCDDVGCSCLANGNPVEPRCVCRHTGYVFQGGACVPDLAACDGIDACDYFRAGYTPIAPADRWFELHVSGALELDLVDEWHSDFYWDSDGTLRLYYNWYARHCGSIGFYLGDADSVPAGTYPLPDPLMSLGFAYADRSFAAVSGSVTVARVDWCSGFDCTVVDIAFEARFEEIDAAATVDIVGTIRGSAF